MAMNSTVMMKEKKRSVWTMVHCGATRSSGEDDVDE
jgi:hypothetical protein